MTERFRRRPPHRHTGRVYVHAGQLSFDNLWAGAVHRSEPLSWLSEPPRPVNEDDLMAAERLRYANTPIHMLRQMAIALRMHPSSDPRSEARRFIVDQLIEERQSAHRERRTADILARSRR